MQVLRLWDMGRMGGGSVRPGKSGRAFNHILVSLPFICFYLGELLRYFFLLDIWHVIFHRPISFLCYISRASIYPLTSHHSHNLPSFHISFSPRAPVHTLQGLGDSSSSTHIRNSSPLATLIHPSRIGSIGKQDHIQPCSHFVSSSSSSMYLPIYLYSHLF